MDDTSSFISSTIALELLLPSKKKIASSLPICNASMWLPIAVIPYQRQKHVWLPIAVIRKVKHLRRKYCFL